MTQTLLVILILLIGSGVEAQADNPEYRPGNVLSLVTQNGTVPHESGTARLTSDGKTLIVTADFVDSAIGNSAKANNERTWLTGDVCELFFMPCQRSDYYEFHVTPNGKTLQLHIKGLKYLKKVPFETQFFESGFKTEARTTAGRWTVRMEIPLKSLGENVQINGSLFAVCRYNYSPDKEKPELSSSPQLPESFHCPTRWYRIAGFPQ